MPLALSDDQSDYSRIQLLAVRSNASLLQSCVQDLFAAFVHTIVDTVSNLTDIHATPQDGSMGRGYGNRDSSYNYRFSNRHIDRLTECFVQSGLGSAEQALLSIIPALRSKQLLPPPNESVQTMFRIAKDHKKRKAIVEAEKLLHWLYLNHRDSRSGEASKSTSEDILREIGELYRSSLLNYEEKGSYEFGCKGVLWMRNAVSHPTDAESELVNRYLWVALYCTGHSKNINLDASQRIREAGKDVKHLVPGWTDMSLKEALVDSSSIYPQGLLVFERWREEVKSFSTGQQDKPPMAVAAERGCKELLEDMLNEGLQRDVQDSEGCTPLMAAARSGNCDCLYVLLEAGANVAIRDWKGETAFSIAAKHSQPSTAKILSTRVGVDVNCINSEGNSPLHISTIDRNADMLRFMLRLINPVEHHYRGHLHQTSSTVILTALPLRVYAPHWKT